MNIQKDIEEFVKDKPNNVFFLRGIFFKEEKDVPPECDECYGRAWFIMKYKKYKIYILQEKKSGLYNILLYKDVKLAGASIIDVYLMHLVLENDKVLGPILKHFVSNMPIFTRFLYGGK